MVPYPATVDVPHELVEHAAWILYDHRREINSRRRKLGCFKQALLTLAHLRKNETFAQVGAGFGVSEATAWRYVDETLDALASWAPGPHEALTGPGEGDHVIVDGTLSFFRSATDRVMEPAEPAGQTDADALSGDATEEAHSFRPTASRRMSRTNELVHGWRCVAESWSLMMLVWWGTGLVQRSSATGGSQGCRPM